MNAVELAKRVVDYVANGEGQLGVASIKATHRLAEALLKCVKALEWYENHSWTVVEEGNKSDAAWMTFQHDKGERARRVLDGIK